MGATDTTGAEMAAAEMPTGDLPVADDAANAPAPEEAVTVFATEDRAENPTPVELNPRDREETAVGFTPAEPLDEFLAAADEAQTDTAVSAFANEDEAVKAADEVSQVTLLPEEEEGQATAYVDQTQLESLMGAAGTEEEMGAAFFASEGEAAAEGGEDVVPLRVQREDEDDIHIVYAAAAAITEVLADAEMEDQEGLLTMFATEEAAEEQEVEGTVGMTVQIEDSEQQFMVYVEAEKIGEFLAQAEEVERGQTILVYAGEEEAAQDMENVLEVLLRAADGTEIRRGFTDGTAVEDFMDASEAYENPDDIEDLARLVYGRLRHRLTVENERRRFA